jgi:thymidylate kinase
VLLRTKRRRGAVVALSGLDGAGKSSQSQALQQALAQLGYDVAVEWIPLADDRRVEAISAAVRKGLRVVRRLPPFRGAARTAESGGSLIAGRGSAGPVTEAWTALITLANASTVRKLARGHLRAGRVVVFDRYELDSIVRLRTIWGDREFRPHRRLLRRMLPRPTAAFLLDVPAETAFARKQDQWDLESLEAQAALYRSEAEALGVDRLDGTLPRDELAASIARAVWRRLRP